MAKVLVTGGAGFIGMHTVKALLEQGFDVVSVDNLNDYYDVNLKEARLVDLDEFAVVNTHDYLFIELDIATDKDELKELFEVERFDFVCHLAAQAGVRYSIDNPQAYIDSNIQGFMNILENCRHHPVQHLVYASSSSVYGKNDCTPYSETDVVDNPVSLYAATKKSNELMAHVYSHLYQIPTTGLRFFTVYGPWGRPDMAYFKFARMILAGESIDVYNHGDLARDFTYIDDIVAGVIATLKQAPVLGDGGAPYELFNIGNNQPVKLLEFIETLEAVMGKKAQKNMLGMQKGDVYATHANIDKLKSAVGFAPSTSLKAGLSAFYAWYQGFYQD
ncbi:MAG: NAD-dependent epimerase/dehydratase family protein [Pseudomonadota bacterium]|nr:NAD-dependent epimerase/dehydratase family protein [Pseudomonadota bacterium]